MTDSLHQYRHSKHSRRLKSVRKQKAKLLLKKQLDSIICSPSNRAKSVLEHQRKGWGKLSKKSKPRAQKRATLLPHEHILDNPWREHPFAACTDNEYDYDSDQSRAYSVDEYSRRKRIFLVGDLSFSHNIPTDQYITPKMLRNAICSLMSHEFASYDLKYMPFDLSTFNGQCSYWHYIMDRIGVLDELFYIYYLSRCVLDQQITGKWYREKIMNQLLCSVHCFYIFDDIKCAANRQFDNDIASAHRVVMNQEDLVHILYRHNPVDLLKDLCVKIGEFVMNKKDISWRYKQHDVVDYRISRKGRTIQTRTKRYKVDGHHVVDRQDPNGDPDDALIGKVYDKLDITEHYNRMWSAYESHEPLYQPYSQGQWRTIVLMTWSKFKEYYHRQKERNREVEWSMIFVILLHFVDSSRDIDFTYFHIMRRRRVSGKKRDIAILKEALSATEHDVFQQRIWDIIVSEGARSCGPSFTEPKFHELLKEGLSHCETNEDVRYLCSMIDEMWFDHLRFDHFDEAMFSAEGDHHWKFKNFWVGIWKDFNSDWNVQPVYDLMVNHCQKYQLFASRESIAYLCVRGRWVWVDVDDFAADRFLWRDIAPMVVDRVIDTRHKETVQLIVTRYKGVMPFDEMVSVIRELERREVVLCEEGDSMHCEYDAMALVSGRRDKYHRNVQSRQRKVRRQRMKREYRKWNGKSEEKRIRRKTKKYSLRVDI